MKVSSISSACNDLKVATHTLDQKPSSDLVLTQASSNATWKKFATEPSSSFLKHRAEEIALGLAHQAFSFCEKNQFEKAIPYYTRAINLLAKADPESELLMMIYYERAGVYVQTEKYDLAVIDFDAAILIPQSFEPIHGYDSKSRFRREKALAHLATGNEEHYLQDVRQSAKEGDLVAALLLKREENIDPYIPPIDAEFKDLEYAEYLFANVRYTLAIEELTKYIDALKDADPDIFSETEYTRALALRGVSYALLGKNTEALADFEQAIFHEIDPLDIVEYFDARALINLSIGNKAAAEFDLSCSKEMWGVNATSILIWKLFYSS